MKPSGTHPEVKRVKNYIFLNETEQKRYGWSQDMSNFKEKFYTDGKKIGRKDN